MMLAVGLTRGHLARDSGGPRGPHPGRERRAGPGRPLHLHAAHGGGGGGNYRSHSVARRPASGPGPGVDAGGGRRSPGAPVRRGRVHPGGLCARRHRRPRRRAPPHGGALAPPGTAGPEDSRRAGGLPVGLRPGGDHRPGPRNGGGGLHGQALLAHGADGQDPGGAVPAVSEPPETEVDPIGWTGLSHN